MHRRTLLVPRIQTLVSLWNFPCRFLELSDLVKKTCRGYFMDPELSQGYLKVDSSFTLGFMGLWYVFPLSVQEKMGLLVGRDHLIFSLPLPISAHLSASSFNESTRWALTRILMKMVTSRNTWSICSRRSCTIVLTRSVSWFDHMERDLPSPDHFWAEERRRAGSDRKTSVFRRHFLYFRLPVAGMPLPVPACWRSFLPLPFKLAATSSIRASSSL